MYWILFSLGITVSLNHTLNIHSLRRKVRDNEIMSRRQAPLDPQCFLGSSLRMFKHQEAFFLKLFMWDRNVRFLLNVVPVNLCSCFFASTVSFRYRVWSICKPPFSEKRTVSAFWGENMSARITTLLNFSCTCPSHVDNLATCQSASKTVLSWLGLEADD